MRCERTLFVDRRDRRTALRCVARRAGGRLDRKLGRQRRLSRRSGRQLPDLASVRSAQRRRKAGADPLLQRDRPISACHRRGSCGETRRRRGARGDRPRDRPRADLRRGWRRDDRAGRGGGVRSGRDGSAAALDAGDQHVRAALDRPGGHPSRRGRHDLYLGRRRLHRSRGDALAAYIDLALLHRRSGCRGGRPAGGGRHARRLDHRRLPLAGRRQPPLARPAGGTSGGPVGRRAGRRGQRGRQRQSHPARSSRGTLRSERSGPTGSRRALDAGAALGRADGGHQRHRPFDHRRASGTGRHRRTRSSPA